MKYFTEKCQTMEKHKSRNYQQLKNYESRSEKVASSATQRCHKKYPGTDGKNKFQISMVMLY